MEEKIIERLKWLYVFAHGKEDRDAITAATNSLKAWNKVKAEIEEQAKINQNLNIDRARTLCWCLDVIDKYLEGVKING